MLKFHQINVKISNFYNLKLCIQNKFINRIVNNIQFEQNLICMLRAQGTWNLTVRFSKFTPKKEIYKKFEKFHSKLVWNSLSPKLSKGIKLKWHLNLN